LIRRVKASKPSLSNPGRKKKRAHSPRKKTDEEQKRIRVEEVTKGCCASKNPDRKGKG